MDDCVGDLFGFLSCVYTQITNKSWQTAKVLGEQLYSDWLVVRNKVTDFLGKFKAGLIGVCGAGYQKAAETLGYVKNLVESKLCEISKCLGDKIESYWLCVSSKVSDLVAGESGTSEEEVEMNFVKSKLCEIVKWLGGKINSCWVCVTSMVSDLLGKLVESKLGEIVKCLGGKIGSYWFCVTSMVSDLLENLKASPASERGTSDPKGVVENLVDAIPVAKDYVNVILEIILAKDTVNVILEIISILHLCLVRLIVKSPATKVEVLNIVLDVIEEKLSAKPITVELLTFVVKLVLFLRRKCSQV